MTKVEEILKTGASRLGVVRVKNALNPLLWLSGLASPICLAAALAMGEGSARWFLLSLGALPIGATLVAYFMWAWRDPDRLQSEEYMLEQQRIWMMERKSSAGTPQIEAKPDANDYAEPDSEAEARR